MDDRTTAAAPPSRRALVEAVVASTIGTTIEWYDFFLYGTAASLVFDKAFFSPELESSTRQFLAMATFTVGFIARPLGGVIFGYLGDRIGRKSTLVTTLLLMGVSTLLVGFMPTYQEIGVAAPILLTVLRFLQGLGVGGEWGGAVLMALEYGHQGRRGFVASWPQAGVPLGLLASTLTLTAFQTNLSPEEFLTWGWRVPFYLSGLLIVVGLLIRMRIFETPLFAKLKEDKQTATTPLRDTIRGYWREILLAAGSRLTENACFYIFALYALSYGEKVLHVQPGIMLHAVNVAAFIEFFTIPLFGVLSDRFSRRHTYMVGCLYMIALPLPYFWLLNTKDPTWIMVGTVLGLCVGHALLYSVQASLIPELFGTKLRCTGASIGYQLAVPLAGGLAPLIAVALVAENLDNYWRLALYMMAMSVVSLACVYLLAETSKKDISA